MDNIFRKVFCANIKLEELANLYGYDEEQTIELLDNIDIMTIEERKLLEELINERL